MFTCYPLLVAALSGPVLGEKVGWRRWAAIGVGFVGVLIILQPGSSVFTLGAGAAGRRSCSLYGLLTRYVARKDSASVGFFWTGTAGALAMTAWPVALAGDDAGGLGLDAGAVLHCRSLAIGC